MAPRTPRVNVVRSPLATPKSRPGPPNAESDSSATRRPPRLPRRARGLAPLLPQHVSTGRRRMGGGRQRSSTGRGIQEKRETHTHAHVKLYKCKRACTLTRSLARALVHLPTKKERQTCHHELECCDERTMHVDAAAPPHASCAPFVQKRVSEAPGESLAFRASVEG